MLRLTSFLSTPSARRATRLFPPYFGHRYISIHALREEGDIFSGCPPTRISYFYPRPPRGGRLRRSSCRWCCRSISIHALREEGDYIGMVRWGSRETFLSTPSARRATGCRSSFFSAETYFYPRPPRGGRPLSACCFRGSLGISIHALREEGDQIDMPSSEYLTTFLSTPSARRATWHERLADFFKKISIHALREEGDLMTGNLHASTSAFLSTPSARRATSRNQATDVHIVFLSTPSARRATRPAALRRTKQ